MKTFKLSLLISSTLALALIASGAAAEPVPGLAPAPPPPGPHGDHPPPPPRGPSIRVERDAGGALRLDVHCGEADTAKSCADTTLAVFDKVNAGAAAK